MTQRVTGDPWPMACDADMSPVEFAEVSGFRRTGCMW